MNSVWNSILFQACVYEDSIRDDLALSKGSVPMVFLPSTTGEKEKGTSLCPNSLFLVMGMVMMHSSRMGTVSSLLVEGISRLRGITRLHRMTFYNKAMPVQMNTTNGQPMLGDSNL